MWKKKFVCRCLFAAFKNKFLQLIFVKTEIVPHFAFQTTKIKKTQFKEKCQVLPITNDSRILPIFALNNGMQAITTDTLFFF